METVFLSSEAETEAWGKRLAELLQPGDVVALNGPLGAGKTRLTRAIAQGLGVSAEEVSSPTFTLIQEYSGRFPVRHCDAYRLKSAAEFFDLGLDELFAPDGVALIEWAERVAAELPAAYLEIRLTPTGSCERAVSLTGHGARGAELAHSLLHPGA